MGLAIFASTLCPRNRNTGIATPGILSRSQAFEYREPDAFRGTSDHTTLGVSADLHLRTSLPWPNELLRSHEVQLRAILRTVSTMSPQHTDRPPRRAPNFIDNPFNIIIVILVPIIAGLIIFTLGPNLENAPAILEKIPTPWTAFFG
jgi:hypothetical protein